MKHSIQFIDNETGKAYAISSKIFGDKKELFVAEYDDSEKGYHKKDITITQFEEHER